MGKKRKEEEGKEEGIERGGAGLKERDDWRLGQLFIRSQPEGMGLSGGDRIWNKPLDLSSKAVVSQNYLHHSC